MWRNASTTREEPVSDHKVTSAEDRHNLDVLDQQNPEAAGNTLSHQDVHEGKHFSHQDEGLANDEKLQC